MGRTRIQTSPLQDELRGPHTIFERARHLHLSTLPMGYWREIWTIPSWRTRNRSPHTRRQELFNRSKGSLSCFLDSDDYWEPSRLEEHVHVFQRHPWLGLSWDRFKDVGINQHIRQPFPAGLVEPPR